MTRSRKPAAAAEQGAFAVGSRVRVSIVDRSRYASGAGAVYDGLTGKVESFSPNSTNGYPFPGPAFLVAFDAPPLDPSPMAWEGRRVECHWFPTCELREEAAPAQQELAL